MHSPSLPPISFSSASEDDFERLLALKDLVQRPHLERIGRYSPERSRSRFRDAFAPGSTRLIHVDGQFAGCVTVHRRAAETEVENFYLTPECQGRGIGSAVMRMLMDEASDLGQAVRVTVLNQSAANAFYQRLGFAETDRDPIDIRYVWSG